MLELPPACDPWRLDIDTTHRPPCAGAGCAWSWHSEAALNRATAAALVMLRQQRSPTSQRRGRQLK